jgi:hypothetical protein
MGHFSANEAHCRVDFFKETGKWYATEMLDFSDLSTTAWKTQSPVETIKELLQKQFSNRYSGMWAVVLQPYVNLSFPVMVRMPTDE